MEITGIVSLRGYARIALSLNHEEATVISSILGMDICSSRSRFIDIGYLEKSLIPHNLYSSKLVESSGCMIVLNVPEEYLETFIRGSDLSGLNNYFNFLSKLLSKLYQLLVETKMSG